MTAGVLAVSPCRSCSVIACTSETPRSSSRAICRLERFRPIRYRHSTQSRGGWWWPAARQVVEARPAVVAAVALPLLLGIVPPVADHPGAAAPGATDALGPALL